MANDLMKKVGELLDLAGLDQEVIKSVTEKLIDEKVQFTSEDETEEDKNGGDEVKAEKSEGAKPVGIIAVGYGQTQGVPHKTKTAEQVSSYDGEAPQWFKNGIEAALLAPTALAKQAFTIKGKGNKVSISCNNGIFTGVDTGLVKYHFELGAGKGNFQWE